MSVCLIVVAGCDGDRVEREPAVSRPVETSDAGGAGRSPIAGIDPEFDFGAVFAGNQTLQHAFEITNHGPTPIRLVRATALTPCCSSVEPLPSEPIAPGGRAEVETTLRVGSESGLKRVEFLVETDSAEHPMFRLGMSASLIGEWEVRPIDATVAPLMLGQVGERHFRIACRRKGDKGRTLPREIAAAPPLSAEFPGEPSEQVMPDGVIEATREVRVMIATATGAGTRYGDLLLRWADGRTETHLIGWSVLSALTSAPTGFILEPGTRGPVRRKVFIRSSDRPFRIKAASGPLVADSFHPPTEAAKTHQVELTIDADQVAAGGATDVRFETDHPSQPDVSISVIALPGPAQESPK